jgi:glycine dehydrogenase
LIPTSAHGTNPASAILAGFKIVTVNSESKNGYVDLDDLKEKAEKHKDNLACFMITYPSTFGIYEDGIKTAIEIIH